MTIKLHPPALRALGMKRKIGLRRSARPLLALLKRGRMLRGHAWDPFGHAHVRKVERRLIGEYKSLVEIGLERLGPTTPMPSPA
ncbi:MAG: hypothetical protein JSS68_12670 [Actinobacteria bacterium]|nr:hypothetical protein [Actinomycetota bacterium]